MSPSFPADAPPMSDPLDICCPTCGDCEFEVLTTTDLSQKVMCCACEGVFRIRDLAVTQARNIEIQAMRDRTTQSFRKLQGK
jgi:hypothetical protein